MFSRLSLRYRIALVIFLLEACMLGAVLSVSLTQSRATAAEFNGASQQASFELLFNLSVTALLTNEYSDYQLYIDDMRKQPSIVRIVLADPQQRVVAGTRVADVGHTLEEVVPRGEAGWRIAPVTTAAGALGTLAVQFSDAALLDAYRKTRNLALGIALGGMLLIALVGLATGFALTRRLHRVADTARRFAEGDAAARSQVAGRDEVALLARDVNHMADAVTEQQRALREQGAYIQLLMSSTAEAIYGVDTRGVCTFANPACLQMLGYAREDELVGKDIHARIHHSYPDGSFYPGEECRVRLSTLKGQIAHADDEVHWRKNGSSFPVEYWSHPMYREGELIGAVVTFVDITERKRNEQMLQRHNTLLHTLASANEMLIREPDEQRIMQRVCELLVQELGYRMAWIGLIADDGVRVLPHAHAGFNNGYLDQIHVCCDGSGAGQGPTGTAIRENRTVRNDDTGRNELYAPWRDAALARGYASSSATPIRLDGKPVGALNVYAGQPQAFDEEETVLLEKLSADLGHALARHAAARELQRHRDQLEEQVAARTAQLEATNKELETFSYSVSHDLRAPLRAIDGFSQALLEDYGDKLDAAGRNYLERVRGSAQLMGSLIDDMLKLARVTRTKLQPEPVDVSALARDIVASLREHESAREVTADIADGMRAYADPGLLRVVLENLIHNAWKYTGKTPGAHIAVSVDEQADNAVFQVRDNGVGFDMKHAGKLFGAFQRLHRRDEFEGTGVGLATVQRIVHRHGGQVWAEATPGGGAAFFFTLGHPEQ